MTSIIYNDFRYHLERVVKTLVVFGGITLLTRGMWDMSANYIFPDDTLLSCLASITIGIVIIAVFSPDKVYSLA